ncbi:hypothetical protein DFH08DRAFT_884030 [Mycena albidolilacea]|uniref:Secreted protein n=1 Tax=Mycena albidolilacea TaxID=1033008 RepID=A0AAD6ZMC2_9AGAR|nr:hypothetical protein DFH08DRAFT_884030 [Mycena albidolilacea]
MYIRLLNRKLHLLIGELCLLLRNLYCCFTSSACCASTCKAEATKKPRYSSSRRALIDDIVRSLRLRCARRETPRVCASISIEDRTSSSRSINDSIRDCSSGGITERSGTVLAMTARILIVWSAMSRASDFECFARSAMSRSATTPPTALFRGGNASDASFNARRVVSRRSGNAAEVRDDKEVTLSFAVGDGGLRLLKEEKESRMRSGSLLSGCR